MFSTLSTRSVRTAADPSSSTASSIRPIKEAVAHPNITLLMSCRREDYDTDERLRDLVREETGRETVEVPRLQVEQVRGAIVTAGGDPTELNDQQLGAIAGSLRC